jgi:glycerol-3-phosphate acyltransferase PlsY
MGALILAAAYLLGAIPFGYLFVRLRKGGDVRTEGSGNIGATNVLRTQGKALGVLTLVVDGGKGAAAVYLAQHLMGDSPWPALAAAAAMLGHAYPVFLGFRGGKSVATGAGAFALLHPAALAAALAVFALAVALTRHISVGSMSAACALAAAVYLWKPVPSSPVVLYVALFACALIFLRHHENIRRLFQGGETKITARRAP